MKMMKAAIAALAIAGSSSVATAQNILTNNTVVYNTSSIVEVAQGQHMAGMQVQVCLSTGCTTNSWANLNDGYYGVQNTAYRIRVAATEDTYPLGDWRFDLFSSADLVSVTFNGRLGNTLFDRTLPSPGSPGSSVGYDANLINQCVNPSGGGTDNCVNFDNTNVTYSNRVTVNGQLYGDEYEQVKFDFANVGLSGPANSGGFDDSYTTDCSGRNSTNCSDVGFFLYMDTDRASLTTTAPEPSTYALMFAGLASIGVAARRRRRTV